MSFARESPRTLRPGLALARRGAGGAGGCSRGGAHGATPGKPCAAAVVADRNNCTPSGPPEGGAPPRGWGGRCRVVPARCAVTAAVPHNGHGTAQWRGSDSNRRSPGYGPGEDSAPPPRSMRRGFTRSGAPGAASAPTGRRSAAVVVVVVVRMYETYVRLYVQSRSTKAPRSSARVRHRRGSQTPRRSDLRAADRRCAPEDTRPRARDGRGGPRAAPSGPPSPRRT